MTQLVLGASGFLGSHVARELAGRGERVRVLARPTSNLRALADLIDTGAVVVSYGDVHDPDSVRAAMEGCDVVHHCVVDARPWLRDPAPMFATNVGALPGVMRAALDAGVRRFVFTSSIATLHPWKGEEGGAYVASRLQAEALVLQWAHREGLPAVAMCVANTYGPGDHLPTPHGGLVYAAALGRMPFYVRGASSDVVGIDDAAVAMVLAAEHGRVGERYAISESRMSMQEVLGIGAAVGGVAPPRLAVPPAVMAAAGLAGEGAAAVLRKDLRLTRVSARLMHVMDPVDNTSALADLHWQPRPTRDAIAAGTEWFLARARRRSHG
ncbi:NAD-dependent epimerase/dehydratase family protein [Nocardioides sp. Kera G14]|uniref:NAD-dependent epimerase/dehydratase family protein n=1 Tax=Nocardioides sp. Kera G14 TaxID=2884264 RepID=UPI001D1072E8|nr:NAD-dependent epimerase/dehydratase family protein [Nocardioides sp. Kera G14]UDY22211.1 NAD-dependent epimerase/dehydratase family protein [Nocardioides sp. Kera G14]